MKKMKSWKQQLATPLSLALIVMVITVCVADQTLANGKGRRGASANVQQRNKAVGNYSLGPDIRNNARQRPQSGSGVLTTGTFGRGVIMANPNPSSYGGLKARRQSQGARPNNVSINWGDGNDNFRTAGASRNQSRSLIGLLCPCGDGYRGAPTRPNPGQ